MFTSMYYHGMVPLHGDALLAITRVGRELVNEFCDNPTVKSLEKLIWVVGRPLRFGFLSSLIIDLPEIAFNSDLAKLIVNAYIDTEIFSRDDTMVWRDFLLDYEETLHNHHDGLRAKYCGWSDSALVEVFHGVEYDDDDYTGTAWTLDEDVAKKFATRFGGKREILRGIVTLEWLRDNALFYTNGRGESEVYLPHGVPSEFLM